MIRGTAAPDGTGEDGEAVRHGRVRWRVGGYWAVGMERLEGHPGRALALAVGIAAAAALAVAADAGFDAVADAFSRLDSGWLAVAVAAQFVAFGGYTLGYRGILAASDGPRLRLGLLVRLVATGFGAFAPGGGFVVDYRAIATLEQDNRSAATRVLALGGLEYVVIAPAACICAIVMLADGSDAMPSVLWPWALAVPVGFAAGFAFAPRARRAVGDRHGNGWRMVAHALDAIELLRGMLSSPIRFLPALLGIAVYWAGEVVSLWASLRAVDAVLALGPLVVGLATGYASTRRSLPFAGAGVSELLLVFALLWVGLDLPQAVAGTIIYRLFSFVLPMLPALWSRRDIGELVEPGVMGDAGQPARAASARHGT